MNGAARIALTYFSGANLQAWISLICCVLLVGGLAFAALASNPSLVSGAANVAQVAIIFLVAFPAWNGGHLLRAASTPGIMHLRPHGRRQMILGATIAITLIAALLSLGAVIEELWLHGIEGTIPFGLKPAAALQLYWGCTALVWVATFALSSRPILLAFSWLPFIAVLMLWDKLMAEMSFTRETIASPLFVTGLGAWVAFSLWYLKAPNVLRRYLFGARPGEQVAADLDWLNPGRWFRLWAAGDSRASRNTAVRRYLTDTDSSWSSVGMGAFVTLILAIQYLMFRNADQTPLTIILLIAAVAGTTMAAGYIRRARLLWLRAGLDRSALFATTERLALQATALVVVLPVAAAVSLAVIQQPAVTAAILLHTATQLAFTACAAYAGMTYTRGAPQIFGLFVVLGIPSFVALIKLEPHAVTSPWPHVGALLVFSALVLPLRGLAKRSWLRLDWRLTGAPAQRGFT
jgi:hypothetical protein